MLKVVFLLLFPLLILAHDGEIYNFLDYDYEDQTEINDPLYQEYKQKFQEYRKSYKHEDPRIKAKRDRKIEKMNIPKFEKRDLAKLVFRRRSDLYESFFKIMKHDAEKTPGGKKVLVRLIEKELPEIYEAKSQSLDEWMTEKSEREFRRDLFKSSGMQKQVDGFMKDNDQKIYPIKQNILFLMKIYSSLLGQEPFTKANIERAFKRKGNDLTEGEKMGKERLEFFFDIIDADVFGREDFIYLLTYFGDFQVNERSHLRRKKMYEDCLTNSKNALEALDAIKNKLDERMDYLDNLPIHWNRKAPIDTMGMRQMQALQNKNNTLISGKEMNNYLDSYPHKAAKADLEVIDFEITKLRGVIRRRSMQEEQIRQKYKDLYKKISKKISYQTLNQIVDKLPLARRNRPNVIRIVESILNYLSEDKVDALGKNSQAAKTIGHSRNLLHAVDKVIDYSGTWKFIPIIGSRYFIDKNYASQVEDIRDYFNELQLQMKALVTIVQKRHKERENSKLITDKVFMEQSGDLIKRIEHRIEKLKDMSQSVSASSMQDYLPQFL